MNNNQKNYYSPVIKTRVNTAQTMAYSDSYMLPRQLQTVKTTTDSCRPLQTTTILICYWNTCFRPAYLSLVVYTFKCHILPNCMLINIKDLLGLDIDMFDLDKRKVKPFSCNSWGIFPASGGNYSGQSEEPQFDNRWVFQPHMFQQICSCVMVTLTNFLFAL